MEEVLSEEGWDRKNNGNTERGSQVERTRTCWGKEEYWKH